MIKKVLVFNGSPRPKGNTKQMIQAFCEGLETAGLEYGVYEVWGESEIAEDVGTNVGINVGTNLF